MGRGLLVSGGEGDVGAEAEDVKVVVVGRKMKRDGSVGIARQPSDRAGGGGGDSEACADDEIVNDAGGGRAGAHTCAGRAGGRDDAGIEALGESRVRERARIDSEVAWGDEGKRSRSGVGADDGERGEVGVAKAAACDQVNRVNGDGGRRAKIDLDADCRPWHGGGDGDGYGDSVADEGADTTDGADDDPWERALEVRAPIVACGPRAEVGDVFAEDVEFLCGDDGGVGVAEKGSDAWRWRCSCK